MKNYDVYDEEMLWVGFIPAQSADHAISLAKSRFNLAAPAVSLQLH